MSNNIKEYKHNPDYIRALITNTGYTIKDISDILNTAEISINRRISGDVKFSIEEAYTLSVLLDLPITTIFSPNESDILEVLTQSMYESKKKQTKKDILRQNKIKEDIYKIKNKLKVKIIKEIEEIENKLNGIEIEHTNGMEDIKALKESLEYKLKNINQDIEDLEEKEKVKKK